MQSSTSTFLVLLVAVLASCISASRVSVSIFGSTTCAGQPSESNSIYTSGGCYPAPNGKFYKPVVAEKNVTLEYDCDEKTCKKCNKTLKGEVGGCLDLTGISPGSFAQIYPVREGSLTGVGFTDNVCKNKESDVPTLKLKSGNCVDVQGKLYAIFTDVSTNGKAGGKFVYGLECDKDCTPGSCKDQNVGQLSTCTQVSVGGNTVYFNVTASASSGSSSGIPTWELAVIIGAVAGAVLVVVVVVIVIVVRRRQSGYEVVN